MSWQNDVYLTHRAALINYAAPIVGCRAHAEDIVQEAFIKFSAANECDSQGAPISNPASYLYRIVRNLAIDWRRRPLWEQQLPASAQLDLIASKSPSAEDTLLYRDELRILTNALMELPERTRIAFTMHRLEGRTLTEIAAYLEISVVRAHQLVKQAISHGAKRLDESGTPE